MLLFATSKVNPYQMCGPPFPEMEHIIAPFFSMSPKLLMLIELIMTTWVTFAIVYDFGKNLSQKFIEAAEVRVMLLNSKTDYIF